MNLLIFGLGYSARAFVARERARFERVVATSRDPGRSEPLEGVSLLALGPDGADPALHAAIAAADAILVSAPPDAEGDPALRAVEAAIEAGPARWIGYLSTIGVYGDGGGAWIDETAEPNPANARSRRRLEVERAWLALGQRAGKSVAVLRLSGIYGPGRNPFVKLAEGRAQRIVKPGQVFNRIHVDDIAAALAASLDRPEPGAVVNVTDDEPAPPQDVVLHAAGIAGVAPPPEITFADAPMSPMAREFYGENKRVRNARLRESLGVRLAYPTYREGLAALWPGEAWRFEAVTPPG